MNINSKTYLTALIIVLTFFTIINFSSCDDGPSNPNNNDRPLFTWSVDTISFPESFQTSMYTIWGDSDEDLYIAGHNNRGLGKAFYYDGENWSAIIPIVPSGFNTYSFSSSLSLDNETLLFGTAHYFSNDSIINISDSSLILSIKNKNWSISQLGGGGSIETISGTKTGKLYAGGRNLTFLQLKNSKWEKKSETLPIPIYFETKTITDILINQNENSYMFVYCYNGQPYKTKRYFLKEINNKWVIEDSFEPSSNSALFGRKFSEDKKNELIYSYYPGVYLFNGTSWNNIWNKNEIITTIEITEEGDIFAAGLSLYFYNGTNWSEYEYFRTGFGLAQDIIIMQQHIIVLFSNNMQSFVIWGDK